MRTASLLALALLAGLAAACTVNDHVLERPPTSAYETTGGPWSSMIFAARLDGGIVLVDLGWDDDGRALDRALARLDADSAQVAAVFLTHSHRDHIAAWRAVRHARFVIAAAEAPRLLGEAEHLAPLFDVIGDVGHPGRPEAGELRIETFASDTAFAFGADTVRAFAVPGHTAGSAAYLIDDVLFVGDAMTYTPLIGFHQPRWSVTDDRPRARQSLASLLERVRPFHPRWACTAHAKCAAIDSAFVARVAHRDRRGEAQDAR